MSKSKPSTIKTNPAPQMKGVKVPFERLNNYLDRNKSVLLITILSLSVLLVFINFDVKISTAHDDALYIEGGYKMAHLFPNYYYSANAPLYVMFLSLVTIIFGLKIIVMKLFSALFFIASLYFFFKAFSGRVPNVVLFPALMISAFNPMMLSYASLTFTEAFFMMVQALFFWVVFRSLDKADAAGNKLKDTWKYWLLIGLMLFIQYLTRNVAVVTIAATVLFLLYTRRYKAIIYTVIAFVFFVVLYDYGIKRPIWGEVSQFSSQGSVMFLKDNWDPSKGKEDFGGFVERFFTNTGIYYGSRFWEILGFQKDAGGAPGTFGALLTLALFGFGLLQAWKRKNNAIIFAGLYVLALTGITFIALHTSWAQARLIMVYIPYIFLAILFGFVSIIKLRYPGLRPAYIGVVILFVAMGFFTSFASGAKNIPTLFKNLRGDIYAGYTPDWKNFLKMSEWAAENLPDTAYVASRKQPMSFLYGKGKDFFPIYKVPSQDPDSLLSRFRENGVTHVIVGSLRTNPLRADGNVVSTVHRYLATIQQKYPEAFYLVHEIGPIEKAQLYAINYKAIDSRIKSGSPVPSP